MGLKAEQNYTKAVQEVVKKEIKAEKMKIKVAQEEITTLKNIFEEFSWYTFPLRFY